MNNVNNEYQAPCVKYTNDKFKDKQNKNTTTNERTSDYLFNFKVIKYN